RQIANKSEQSLLLLSEAEALENTVLNKQQALTNFIGASRAYASLEIQSTVNEFVEKNNGRLSNQGLDKLARDILSATSQGTPLGEQRFTRQALAEIEKGNIQIDLSQTGLTQKDQQKLLDKISDQAGKLKDRLEDKLYKQDRKRAPNALSGHTEVEYNGKTLDDIPVEGPTIRYRNFEIKGGKIEDKGKGSFLGLGPVGNVIGKTLGVGAAMLFGPGGNHRGHRFKKVEQYTDASQLIDQAQQLNAVAEVGVQAAMQGNDPLIAMQIVQKNPRLYANAQAAANAGSADEAADKLGIDKQKADQTALGEMWKQLQGIFGEEGSFFQILAAIAAAVAPFFGGGGRSSESQSQETPTPTQTAPTADNDVRVSVVDNMIVISQGQGQNQVKHEIDLKELGLEMDNGKLVSNAQSDKDADYIDLRGVGGGIVKLVPDNQGNKSVPIEQVVTVVEATLDAKQATLTGNDMVVDKLHQGALAITTYKDVASLGQHGTVEEIAETFAAIREKMGTATAITPQNAKNFLPSQPGTGR
ncbi:MAG: hypothetical protein KDD76_04385, partial [Rickettsiales bacterium]|nr:hypothetical protein [Rickettsiales bacterium]